MFGIPDETSDITFPRLLFATMQKSNELFVSISVFIPLIVIGEDADPLPDNVVPPFNE